jgi:PKD repeat protein
MRKALPLFFAVVLLYACHKKDDALAPSPVASFSIDDDTTQAFRTAVYSTITLHNNSVSTRSYLWDFGNGTTSNDKDPSVWYTKSGTYTVTLTATGEDGSKAVSSKTIKVLGRVAKQIIVTSLNLKSALGFTATHPSATKVNIWVEILQAAPNQEYPLSRFKIPEAPLVYKTAVATDVDASKVPLVFNVTDKLIIDAPAINKCCGYSGLGYLFNVYAQDNTGIYLLVSNYGSGVGIGFSGDVRKNIFQITTGFDGSNVSINCDYE